MIKLSWYNVAIALVIGLGGFSYGFGSAVFVTSLGQPGFYMYYKLDPSSEYTATVLGAVNAVYFTGAALGSIGQCYLADWLGRKKALAIAGVMGTIGSALVAGSVKVGMLIAVRVLQGAGLGMLLTLVPLYLSEVAPPHRRGFLTGLTVLSFGTGYVISGWIAIGCYHASNLTVAWRTPLALACIPPIALLIGLSFVPETPRFLVWKGRLEEAWTVTQKLHHDPADPHDESAHAEFTQIVRQVEFDKEMNVTFYQMFKKPSWRKRSLSAMFLTFAAQCTGIYGITNYLPVIFQSLGMTGDAPLLLYAGHSTLGTVAVLVSIIIVDKVGRRTLIVWGFLALAMVLLAEALLQWKYIGTDDKAGNAACILFMFIYIVVFQCVDAPAFAWTAEIFPTNLRAKGVSLAIFSLFVGTITFTAPSPLAFRNIGWHMFLLYFALAIVASIVSYFYIVETKNLPMEEIGALFGDEVVVHLTADGHGLVEDKGGSEHIESSAAEPGKV
ncbi:hypothetical protein H2200_005283 [Cladophialophora chaetospira]|uniref:Major facilitator superfamily (MFS) profile domain-containing protein n=1 Tax=Cladophialophora chaetospira TaxID=386627 RepID=A0AA38XBW2_9EURO|nr:hypothetical protein H2200_005283 [Cladophialophora chaetospira]